jgi:tetratricopeptide (TPR) repeat protein
VFIGGPFGIPTSHTEEAMRLAIIFLAVLAVTGCASQQLCHPAKTMEDYKKESYVCDSEAIKRSSFLGNAGLLFLRESEWKKCMEARYGWVSCGNSTTAEDSANENQRPWEEFNPRPEALKISDEYNDLGVEYIESGDFEKAIYHFNESIRLNPNSEPAYYNRGLCNLNIKNFRHAIADFTKAIEINPDDSYTYKNRGMAYAGLKQYNNAIKDFSTSVKINPKNASALEARGVIYIEIGDYDLGCRDVKDACRQDECTGMKIAKKHGLCP